jgi:hypothetical protein
MQKEMPAGGADPIDVSSTPSGSPESGKNPSQSSPHSSPAVSGGEPGGSEPEEVLIIRDTEDEDDSCWSEDDLNLSHHDSCNVVGDSRGSEAANSAGVGVNVEPSEARALPPGEDAGLGVDVVESGVIAGPSDAPPEESDADAKKNSSSEAAEEAAEEAASLQAVESEEAGHVNLHFLPPFINVSGAILTLSSYPPMKMTTRSLLVISSICIPKFLDLAPYGDLETPPQKQKKLASSGAVLCGGMRRGCWTT